jgi:hypothetical protein
MRPCHIAFVLVVPLVPTIWRTYGGLRYPNPPQLLSIRHSLEPVRCRYE